MPTIVFKNKDEVFINDKSHKMLADKLSQTGVSNFVTFVDEDDNPSLTFQVSEISHIKTEEKNIYTSKPRTDTPSPKPTIQ